MLTIKETAKPEYKGFQIVRVERRETNRFNRLTKKFGPRTTVSFEAFRNGEYFDSNRRLKNLKRCIDWQIRRDLSNA
jgi:uncharacterized protein YqfB (UPF0267 family)